MHIADADLTFFYVACAIILIVAVVEVAVRQLGGSKVVSARLSSLWHSRRVSNHILWLLIPLVMLAVALLMPRTH